jgi:hypothetical protein
MKLAALMGLMWVGMGEADAKAPFRPRTERVTAIDTRSVQRIERERTLGRSSVVFHADPQALEEGAVMLLEIHTHSGRGSELRWRCVAVEDLAECLGDAVRVGWRAHDFSAVLTVSVEPKATPRGAALAAEAARRTVPVLARR